MRIEVFAVEDTSLQVCWRGAPPGEVVVTVAGRSVALASHRGLGSMIAGGLRPGATVDVSVAPADGSRCPSRRVVTLVPPPGARLARFATINDMHIGSRQTGSPIRPISDDPHGEPAALGCMRSAIAEAIDWGAEAIVVKGDSTQGGRREEWELVGDLLAHAGVPLLVVEGNHDKRTGAVDGTPLLRGFGIELITQRPAFLDLPGVRIVGVPTARRGVNDGVLEAAVVDETASLLATAPAGAVVAMHHYAQRFRRPLALPRGIPGPAARRAIGAWAAANPALIVVSGHTHRHRRRSYGGVMVIETGSTKDFPGSWAGYTVHEGGIMQTTRRITDPEAMAWTERGRHILGGAWAVLAPGRRADRCFSCTWPQLPGHPPGP